MAFIEEITEGYPADDAQSSAADIPGSDCFSPIALRPKLACLLAVFHPRYALYLFQYTSSRLLKAPLPDTNLALFDMVGDQPVQPIFNSSVNFDKPFAPFPQYLKDLLLKPRGLLTGPQEDHSSRFELLPPNPDADLPPPPLSYEQELHSPDPQYGYNSQPSLPAWEYPPHRRDSSPIEPWVETTSRQDRIDGGGVILPCDTLAPETEGPGSRDSFEYYDQSEPFGPLPGDQTFYDYPQPFLHPEPVGDGSSFNLQASHIGPPAPARAYHYYENASHEQDMQIPASNGEDFTSTLYDDEPSFVAQPPWSRETDEEPIGSVHSYCSQNKSAPVPLGIRAEDEPTTREMTSSYDYETEQEQQYSSQSQWRVGRLPGHQGSHVRSPKRDSADMSPSPPHRSPERVLKKPFRPPTKVILPRIGGARPIQDQPGTDRQYSASVHNDTVPHKEARQSPDQRRPPARIVLPRKAHTGQDDHRISQERPEVDYQPARPDPLPRITTARVSKPFKQPGSAVRSVGRSVHRPTPYPLSPNNPGSNRSDAREVMKLEDRLRTLKSALRYLNEPEEDEKLASLIDTWRDAGRQVAEMLYQRYPKPEPDDPWSNSSRPSAGGQWGINSIAGDWSGDELSDEQRRYLANLTVNKNGDTVDREGNLVYPDEGPDDIRSLLRIDSRTKPYEDRRGRVISPTGDYDFVTEPSPARSVVSLSKWTIGSVMLKLGVDPDLLGWEDSEEGWRE